MLFIVALPCSILIKGNHEKPDGYAANFAGSGVSPAEEIERFAALKEKGLISAEEFEAKRRQLLGLSGAGF